jgi:hypothetical protein
LSSASTFTHHQLGAVAGAPDNTIVAQSHFQSIEYRLEPLRQLFG